MVGGCLSHLQGDRTMRTQALKHVGDLPSCARRVVWMAWVIVTETVCKPGLTSERVAKTSALKVMKQQPVMMVNKDMALPIMYAGPQHAITQ